MSTALATQAGGALALSEEELIGVLTSSLYPGANIASIKMVLGYCKAAGLDPMQKPVHIVPMWDGKAKQMRDVVMPGVGLYRTQASRTGTFAGQSEPEFGPMVTARLGGVEITYPEFAKVTVKKTMANGTVADFTAVEYWIENYAVKGGQEKSVAPNAMWMKRPRGQIAKCAAAQALRLAFPEMGAQPTAEEMEGKSLQDDAPAAHAAPEVPAELIRAADEAAVKGVAAYQAFWSEAGPASRKLLAAGHEMRKSLAAKADADRTVDAEPAEEVQA
jgi:phage recombination protein Bet